jgi:hypothetical protein
MNIKINEEEYLELGLHIENSYVIGSRLYNTHTEDSDYDILYIIKPFLKSDNYYPNWHQFQYDSEDGTRQNMFTTKERFYRNLLSGESTINADIIMFTDFDDLSPSEKLNHCRTYNVIKAFLGFAKRDLNRYNSGKNKHFHAARSIYCGEKLMNNELPNLEELSKYVILGSAELMTKCIDLRKVCNNMMNNKELTMFPKELIFEPKSSLERKVMEANNILEFKYD